MLKSRLDRLKIQKNGKLSRSTTKGVWSDKARQNTKIHRHGKYECVSVRYVTIGSCGAASGGTGWIALLSGHRRKGRVSDFGENRSAALPVTRALRRIWNYRRLLLKDIIV